MIHQKSLAIRYKPGKDILLADAMSRHPSYSSEEI